ncbi:MAG: M20/M25/M40 family metallo-hydrolase, partial [Longimicrobiales bacterium]
MRLSLVVTLIALLLLPTSGEAQSAADFEEAGQEAVRMLQDLIRIDTSNPPGNETEVAEYVKAALEAEGMSGEIFALDPARGNLVVRLPGNGSEEPILIMAHSDVVGVEPEAWTVDPFAGEIRDDGYLYGRGATDDKDMIAVGAQVLKMIKRSG